MFSEITVKKKWCVKLFELFFFDGKYQKVLWLPIIRVPSGQHRFKVMGSFFFRPEERLFQWLNCTAAEPSFAQGYAMTCLSRLPE